MANKTTQFFAFLALFGIIISVVGTGLLIFFGDSNISDENVITQEQLQEIVNKNNIQISNSGAEDK